ncbi:MAG: mechanosensitive ion channel [Candidatus Riflebacteria bacterium]|nr:mechanosensitive ion channel [Candidatus Riflebacteria bacterium]
MIHSFIASMTECLVQSPRRGKKPWYPWFVLVILFTLSCSGFRAEAAKPVAESGKSPTITKTLTSDDLDSFLRMANVDAKLEAESKTKIEDLIRRAQDALNQASEWEKKAQDFDRVKTEAPQRIAALQKEAEDARESATPYASQTSLLASGSTLEGMDQELLRLGAQEKSLEQSLQESEAEKERLAARRLEAPKELGDVLQKLEKKETTKTPSPPAASSQGLVFQATEIQAQAFQKMLQANVLALEKESETYDLRFALVSAIREKFARDLSDIRERIKAVRVVVDEQRKKETEDASRAANEALASLSNAHPFIQKLAAENADLASKREKLIKDLSEIGNELEAGSKLLGTVRDNFNSIKEKVTATGFTDAIGFLLRSKLGGLPSARDFRNKLRLRESLIAQTQFEIIESREKLYALADIPGQIQKRFSQELLASEPVERSSIEAMIKDSLSTQRTFLEALQGDYNQYYARLVDYNALDKRLLAITVEATNFLNENVLWLRSCKSFGLEDLKRIGQSVPELFSQARGMVLLKGAYRTLTVFPIMSLLALVLLVVLFRRIGHWRQRLNELSVLIVKASTDKGTYSFEALLLTFLLSLPVPILVYSLGLLVGSGDGDEFNRVVGNAMNETAWLMFGLIFLKKVFCEKGLAFSHFRWFVEDVCQEIRRGLTRLIWCGIPFFFFFRVIAGLGDDSLGDSLGRCVYLCFLLVFLWSWNLIFHPSSAAMKKIGDVNPNRWIYKTRYFLFAFGAILPGFMVLGALAGYFYTVQKLFSGMLSSLALGVGVLVAYSFCMRLLFVRRRSLALEIYASRKMIEEKNQTPIPGSGEEFGPAEEESLSINEMSVQTQNLVISLTILVFVIGMWFIWEDLLPALRILDRVQLWNTTIKGVETLTGPNGKITENLIDKIVIVSLLDLVIAISLLVLTFVTSKNLPAFLELSILKQLPLDNGVRFAIGSITSYVITTLGVIISFQFLGIYWEKLQWLVAAVSVGLGFGLQEIFANFISGLIILFERPVRVGDLITVADSTGVVTRIEIRATTIRDADRREAIIPNKYLITNKVVNWTLSDTIRRLVFMVGVAYGNKPDRVREVLLKVAKDNPRVMKDPGPDAVMVGFGDSSLNFELRVFIPNPENYIDFQQSMYAGIEQALAEAKIEIPFPQQEIKVRMDK